VKTKLDELFVRILQQQQEIILLSNWIENFDNKLGLFILFIILSFLDSKSITSLELFFDFKDSALFNSINFNKFFEIIKLLDTLQNLLSQNLDLTLQRHSKLCLHRNKFVDFFILLFKTILSKLYKSKIYVEAITNVYYKIN